MAILTNLDAIRGDGLDEMVRRVHQEHEDFVIEDQTMPVAAVVDINKYQLLEDLLRRQDGMVTASGSEPKVRGSDISIRELAERHQMGDDIDALRHRFSMLNQGQIYSGLAYYYEHSDEIDQLIAQRRAERANAYPSSGTQVVNMPPSER